MKSFLPLIGFALLHGATVHAAALVWDNGATTGNWNTVDANWTTANWSNATPDDAVFNNRGETVVLTQSIICGSLTVNNGGEASGVHQLTLTGSPLVLGGIVFNGAALGDTVDSIYVPNAKPAQNQRLTLESISVNATGNVLVSRGFLEITGTSNVTISGLIGVVPSQAWQNLILRDTAALTVAGGIDFRGVGSNISLEGGTLTTPFLWGNNTNFNGGTRVLFDGVRIIAAASEANFLRVSNNTDAAANSGVAEIGFSGVTIDTAGFDAGIATPLAGSGQLTKEGAGMLTLTAANTYTGNTVVNGGSLTLGASGSLKLLVSGTSANSITGTAGLKLDGTLVIDTAAADPTHGNTWPLIDVGTLAETYGQDFTVAGFTGSAGVWTRIEGFGARTWTFTEATGVLRLDVDPTVVSYTLNSRGPAPAGEVQTTWITSGVSELPTGPGGNHRLNEWAVIGTNDRLLLSFDLRRIVADAGGRQIVVKGVKLEALRSGWATGWASTTLFSVNPFAPDQTVWDNQPAQETYLGDVGGNNIFTMTWDSSKPGTNPWDSVFVNLVPDVQGDFDNNRTTDYVMRVNNGNEWSAVIGTDQLGMTLVVQFIDRERSSFEDWIAGYPLVPAAERDPEDDPDGDGANNLQEFALKGDPSSGSDTGLSGTRLQDTAAPAGNELTLVIAVRDGATFAAGVSGIQTATVASDQLAYTIEGSIDLIFPAAAVSHVSVSDTAPGLPDLTGTAWEYHTFRLDASEGLAGKGFLRAKITSP